MEMQILDNKTQGKVIDKLKENIKTGTKLSIILHTLLFMLTKN